MSVYKSLLLSHGGGVLSTVNQVEQMLDTVSIIIGLGGTGIDCLRDIKTQVHSRIKAYNPKSDDYAYPHIRLLGVDSDELCTDDEEANVLPLEDTEFFSLSLPHLKNGANGIKNIGQLLFMEKAALFFASISDIIQKGCCGLMNPSINIHIISGLTGGTGAGCFLDVCYVLRFLQKKFDHLCIFGYFFMPDVNFSKVPEDWIRFNGYSSMQELDYCMNFPKNGGSFMQDYKGGLRTAWNEPPVDMCFLVDAITKNNDLLPESYHHAIHDVSEFITNRLMENSANRCMSNILTTMPARMAVNAQREKPVGANCSYCTFGRASATIPIYTYLVSVLFERFTAISSNIPSRADVESLVSNYDSLMRELCEGVGYNYTPYPGTWKFVRDCGDSELVMHYTSQTAAKLNRVEANFKRMTTPSDQQSFFIKIRTWLTDIMEDIDRGPIFAYRLIADSKSHNLINIIDSLLVENTCHRNQKASQVDFYSRAYETAKADFENRRHRSVLDNNRKRFVDYENSLMRLEKYKLSMNIYEKLDETLREFRKQIVDITDRYYTKLRRVMETLVNTFGENWNDLLGGKVLAAEDSSVHMITIDELKSTIDEEIDKICISELFRRFMRFFLRNEDEWISEEEKKITRLVESFLKNEFCQFPIHTIIDLLEDKYGIVNRRHLSKKICEDWVEPLSSKANHCCFINDSIWRESQTVKSGFLEFPDGLESMKEAVEKMYKARDMRICKGAHNQYGISATCVTGGFPLFASDFVQKYEPIYYSHVQDRLYADEYKINHGMAFIKQLPLLTPQSMVQIERVPYTMKQLITAGRKLYDEAESKGVFDEQNRICRPDKNAIAEINSLAQACVELANTISHTDEVKGAKKVLSELTAAANAIPMIPTVYSIKNDSFVDEPKTKKILRKDYFVSSPAYHPLVKDILKDLEDIEDIIQYAKLKLTTQIDKIKIIDGDSIDYCDS